NPRRSGTCHRRFVRRRLGFQPRGTSGGADLGNKAGRRPSLRVFLLRFQRGGDQGRCESRRTRKSRMVPTRHSGDAPGDRAISAALRRSLALLAVLLGTYGITLGYRLFSAAEPDTSIGRSSTTAGSFEPPRDLAWVPANPTVPIERSPFRFTEIA